MLESSRLEVAELVTRASVNSSHKRASCGQLAAAAAPSPSSIPPFERYKNVDGMVALQSNPTSP